MKTQSAIWVSVETPEMDVVRLLHDAFQRVEIAEPGSVPHLSDAHVVLVATDDGGERALTLLTENLPHRAVAWIHSDDHLPSVRARGNLLASGCLDVLPLSHVSRRGELHMLAARAAGSRFRMEPSARYERMINHSQDVLTVLDVEGIIQFESPSLTTVLGWKPEDLIGRSFSDHVHDDDRGRLLAKLSEYGHREGVRVTVEYRFRHADGSWRILESRATTVRTTSGAMEVIVSSRDVTHFRTAMSEIKHREDQLSEAQRIGHIGSWRWDVGTDRLDWSAEHCRMYGFEPGSPVSYHRFQDAIHADDRDAVRNAISRSMDTHEPLDMNHRIVRPNGEERMIHLRGEVVLDEGRHAVAMFGTSHDVTEAERSKAAARLTQNRFRELFKLSPDAILLADRNGVIFDANDAATRLFGPGAGDNRTSLAGTRLHGLLAPDFRSEGPDGMERRAFPEGRVDVLLHDGSMHPVTAHVNAIAEPDGDIQIVYLRDEGERLRHEALLRNLSRHQGDLLEAERTRISREVHDVLGQELTALKIDVAWVVRHFGEDEALGRLGDIDARLSSTLETARRIAHELRPGILDDFGLAAAIDWQARQFGKRSGLTVRLGAMETRELPDGLTTAIFRIFQELLTNIARHAQAAAIDVSLTCPGENLVLVVKDDGVGIREKDGRAGESLGLLGMRERIAPWNGRLTVHSAPGHGTTVEVLVPVIHS
ncbi:MAG: PAS domain S-box protein [Rhodothermales bacterium]